MSVICNKSINIVDTLLCRGVHGSSKIEQVHTFTQCNIIQLNIIEYLKVL